MWNETWLTVIDWLCFSDGIESEDSDASAEDDRPFNRDELAVKALKTVKLTPKHTSMP